MSIKTKACGFLLMLLASHFTMVQANSIIVVDSSLPTNFNAINHSPHDLSGSGVITINGHTDGVLSNHNLFFSFGVFGIGAGDTALFTCSGCNAINNVISRVTGGIPSLIEGNLSSNIANANFWLLNPNGVLFGTGGSVDVPAAFHISDATRLYDTNGSNYFSADLMDTQSTLSISPANFGFTGSEQVGLSLDGNTITAGLNGSSSIDITGSTILIQGSNNLNANDVSITAVGGLNIINGGYVNFPQQLKEVSQNGAQLVYLSNDGIQLTPTSESHPINLPENMQFYDANRNATVNNTPNLSQQNPAVLVNNSSLIIESPPE